VYEVPCQASQPLYINNQKGTRVEHLDIAGAPYDATEYADWHAARGELLRRLGRTSQATEALAQAAELTANDAQAGFLRARLTAL
jgi:RNA polymerase sigma-70 factor (ECF subfamily)